MSDESSYIIEAFGIRAAVIIDDGLTEVQSVSQRLARDSTKTGLDRLKLKSYIGSTA